MCGRGRRKGTEQAWVVTVPQHPPCNKQQERIEAGTEEAVQGWGGANLSWNWKQPQAISLRVLQQWGEQCRQTDVGRGPKVLAEHWPQLLHLEARISLYPALMLMQTWWGYSGQFCSFAVLHCDLNTNTDVDIRKILLFLFGCLLVGWFHFPFSEFFFFVLCFFSFFLLALLLQVLTFIICFVCFVFCISLIVFLDFLIFSCE